MPKRRLLTRGASSPKLAKGGEGIESVILHLASGKKVCPWASNGCLAACLTTAGRGQMTSVQEARQRRTDAFFTDRVGFLRDLSHELTLLERRAAKAETMPVARLNGTSDIPWEATYLGGRTLFELHSEVTFYDYTKSLNRAKKYVDGEMPANYSLTLSRTEDWPVGRVEYATAQGINVAVVFEGSVLPATFEGVEVIDGRKNDWRFRDPRGVVVGLSALGKGKADTSGFVVTA